MQHQVLSLQLPLERPPTRLFVDGGTLFAALARGAEGLMQGPLGLALGQGATAATLPLSDSPSGPERGDNT